jgi:hypothetical protein
VPGFSLASETRKRAAKDALQAPAIATHGAQRHDQESLMHLNGFATGLGAARLVPLRPAGELCFGAGVHPFLGAGLNCTRLECVKSDDASIGKHSRGGDLVAETMKTRIDRSGSAPGDTKLSPVADSLLAGYVF